MIVLGTWNRDRDEYFETGTDFTVLLKRSRLYRSFKQTPVHLSGIKDQHANAHQLIDDGSRRGKKVRETCFQGNLPVRHGLQRTLVPSIARLDVNELLTCLISQQ